jgi:hypothetical protein
MTLPITGFVTPTFPRHPLAGVNLLLGNSLR